MKPSIFKTIFTWIYNRKDAIDKVFSMEKHLKTGLFDRFNQKIQTQFPRLHETCNNLLIKWKSLSSFTRNLCVGIIISFILLCFHDSQPFQSKQDAAMDWMMQIFRGHVSQDQKNIPGFVFLDIDEETFQNWGEPFFTPRDKLLKLIRFAVNGNAPVVMADIDLSHESYNETENKPRERHPHDKKLFEYLNNYSDNCSKIQNASGNISNCPQIILARSFRLHQKNSAYPEIRSSFLDKAVENSKDVHWASILFTEDKDHTIRRWRLWEVSCNETGQPDVIPAMQILAAAFVKQPLKKADTIASELETYLKQFTPENCLPKHKKSQPPIPKDPLQLGHEPDGIILTSMPSLTNQRILYKMPWKLPKKEQRPPNLNLRIVPAKTFVDNDKVADFSNMIVIIGSSCAETRDIYPTPLGQSPGALIILDATHSLIRYGEIQSLSIPGKLLIEIVLVIFMSYVFSRFNEFWSMFFAGAFIYACLLPLSFILFKSGVWLDFAIPLIGIQLRQTAAGFNNPKTNNDTELKEENK